MPHNYRREGSGRRRDEHAERDDRNRDRYLSGDQDRFSPRQEADFNQDRDSDRSYFAAHSDLDRQTNNRGTGRGWQDRAGRDREPAGRQTERRTESSGDQYRSPQSQRSEGNSQYVQRSGQGSNRDSDSRDRASTMHWDDRNDEGRYFGTGSYHGAYRTGPASRAGGSSQNEHGYLGDHDPLWRNEPVSWREDDERSAGSTGRSQVYGNSRYGAQDGFDRPYASASSHQRGFGQEYREQFAEQRYGREPAFGYGFTEGASGAFRGRGPKGYQRSDERMREIICERLTDDPRIDASEVHIEVKDKVVKLTGHVPDRRTKYEIEDVVEHCGGVSDIDNQLRVGRGAGVGQTAERAAGDSAPTNEDPTSRATGTSARAPKRN